MTRVKFNGLNYVAKEVYSNGFVSITGKRIHGEPFEVIGPQYCHVCRVREAKVLRTQEDTLYRPQTESQRIEITLSRFLCWTCAKIEKLPFICKCGSPAVLSLGAKVELEGKEYWFRDQMCEACHESWGNRRQQFLRESLVLVRGIAYSQDGKVLV